jgi:hypothetical protein
MIVEDVHGQIPSEFQTSVFFTPLMPAQDDPYGCFVQPGFFSELVDQVSLVRKMNGLGIIGKANNRGGFARYLGSIIKFDAFPPIDGGGAFLNRLFQNAVQLSGGHSLDVLAIDFIDELEYSENPLTG